MKSVIFDCDGVLVNSEVLLVDSEMAFFRQHGLEYTTEYYMANFMGIPMPDWKAKTSALLVEINAKPLPEDFFDPLEATLSRRIEQELQPVTGAYEALKSLQYSKCVASSSSNQSLVSKLKSTGLFELFDPHVFSTELVSHGKPAPDLFLHAANQLDVLPIDCIVVEDSANGVLAGKRAGMQVIGFTGGGHCPPGHANALLSAGADFVATHFSEIVELLDK
ncbi:MAG: HAD family phosphatase [Gammaproteobacteria bacterium]|nr:HAD family phosphatase [Gammaproteobacteria bacterium]